MVKWRFECDYTEGAHPEVMRRLLETNGEQTTGYGEDAYCTQAQEKIRVACQCPEAQVHFLMGGTQANVTVIRAALRPYQGVLSAETGHIHIHETGAVEASGHKVLALPSQNGKITAGQVREACQAHWSDSSREHMVQPGMVYLSHPTEIGTLYTRRELEEIREVCREWNLYLFLDGARLGYALAAEEHDLELPDLARLCDVFYIGGTKVGALFGEAVVVHPGLQENFRYVEKQQGAMLAKGRLLGIQFDTLFTGDLYRRMGRHGIQMAHRLRNGMKQMGIPFFCDSPTNQQFVILTQTQADQLAEKYSFSPWKKLKGDQLAVRFCTSWATKEEAVEELLTDLQAVRQAGQEA